MEEESERERQVDGEKDGKRERIFASYRLISQGECDDGEACQGAFAQTKSQADGDLRVPPYISFEINILPRHGHSPAPGASDTHLHVVSGSPSPASEMKTSQNYCLLGGRETGGCFDSGG